MSETDEQHYIREEKDGILTFTFNRPDKLNAVTPPMRDALMEAVIDLGRDRDLKVMVIRAKGRYFTAGVDVNYTTARRTDLHDSALAVRNNYRDSHRAFDEIEAVEKPVIVAHQGPCFGLGIEMSASCDFRLAAKSATYFLPELPNLGVIPASGGTSRVTRLVGPAWARWIIMAGERIDADKAESIGLVHAVYADDEFDEKVDAFAQKLAGYSTEALSLAKFAIDAVNELDRGTARNVERAANTMLQMSDEYKERIQAILDRSANKNK